MTELFAELRIRGLGQMMSQLGNLQKGMAAASSKVMDLDKALTAIGKAASIAAGGFGSLIFGAGAIGSPDAWRTLVDSVKWLTAEIGSAFLPYLVQAAAVIQDMARWFRDLNETTKSLLASVVAWGFALAGSVVAIRMLIGLAETLRTVWTAILAIKAAIAMIEMPGLGAAVVAGALATGAAVGGLAWATGGSGTKGGAGKGSAISRLEPSARPGAVQIFDRAEDVWKAAQQAATLGIGAPGRTLETQLGNYEKMLQQIADNTANGVKKPIGPTP